VTELANKLCSKGGEQELVDAIKNLEGVTLIRWRHEAIPAIASRLAGANEKHPIALAR
jgi:hypothetical protein